MKDDPGRQINLAPNIKARLRDLNMTQAQLAEKAGMTQVMVHKLVSGKSKSTSKIVDIARALECSPDSLLYGTSNQVREKEVTPYRVPGRVPVISWVQAGGWCESPDNYPPGAAEEWLPAPRNAGPRTFALRVVNDSMTSPYPGQRSYPHGTIIYVDPDKPTKNGCRVVARANGEYTFKSFIEDLGRYYLKPINPTYDKIEITEDVHICGVVIGSYLPE